MNGKPSKLQEAGLLSAAERRKLQVRASLHGSCAESLGIFV